MLAAVAMASVPLATWGQNQSGRTGLAQERAALKDVYAGAFRIGCAVNTGIASGRNARAAQIVLENERLYLKWCSRSFSIGFLK